MFLLICLGEAIVRTGTGLAQSPQGPGHVVAALATMGAVICVWLIFFGRTQGRVDAWFDRHGPSEELHLGELATFGQQALVIAFVAYAVGTQAAVADPEAVLGRANVTLLFGGMLVCIIAFAIYLARLTGRRGWTPLIACVGLLVLAGALADLFAWTGMEAPLVLSAVMAFTAAWYMRVAPAKLACIEAR
ncbi:low temperature requirement protein LtrA [Schaalia hyovaginalis]|uniref:Low temperature requirement protein LtrA n=1 Tax=Schaalia hyovaginalis TaxID=29316 RepID=A0A923IZD2_9ACTO|nr:low temperature requirement protein LtrA [Schaalia hyovaginalis]